MLIALQSIDGYLGVLLDVLKPKPSFSKYLVVTGDDRTASSVVANLLPLLTRLFNTPDLSSKMRKLVGKADKRATKLREIYQRVTEHILVLSGISRNDKTGMKPINWGDLHVNNHSERFVRPNIGILA